MIRCFLLLVLVATWGCGKPVSAPLKPPAYSSSSILLGQSSIATPLAPGMILSLYGQQLGPAKACFGAYDPAQTETPSAARLHQSEAELRIYPKNLCGTVVTVGGSAAGLLYVHADQINFKVPQEVSATGTTTVQVSYLGQSGPAVTETLDAHAGH